jgi:hypothetical protein
VSDDERYFVSRGIGADSGPWMTFTRRESGALRRVSSPRLPMRETREEAELDLDRWLAQKAYLLCPKEASIYGPTYRARLARRLAEREAQRA